MIHRTRVAGQSEAGARAATRSREEAEGALPPLREEEAIAGAVLQRLVVERDTLAAEVTRAEERIETLAARISQLDRDAEREAQLNHDAGETIDRLDAEITELAQAGDGHEAAVSAAASEAHAAAEVLTTREEDLSRLTEDAARLSARHGSAQRLLEDSRKTLTRAEAAGASATDEMGQAKLALTEAQVKAPDAETFRARFEEDYVRLFGRTVAGLDIEITVWSVNATTPSPDAGTVKAQDKRFGVTPEVRRQIFDPVAAAWTEAGVIGRAFLTPGASLDGPAAISEDETTIIVPSGRRAVCLADGCIAVEKGGA